MREEEWRESIFRSWGVRIRYANPRVTLLEHCEIVGECWVSRRERITIGGKDVHVQRAAYGLFECPIKKGDVVISLCRTELCCWGGHLHRIPREAIKRGRRSRETFESSSVPAEYEK